MKKIIALLVMLSFVAVVFASPVMAGEKQRHRWQGVAIGLGAAILGNAIFNADDGRDYRRPPRQYHPPVVYGNSSAYELEKQRERIRIAEEQQYKREQAQREWEEAERERARRDARREASGYGDGGCYGRSY